MKGFFPDSFAGFETKRFRFVHLDVDLYQPTSKGMETFWPRIVPGGVILVHDYLSPQYPGVRKAVDAFCKLNKIHLIPWCDRLGTGIIIESPPLW